MKTLLMATMNAILPCFNYFNFGFQCCASQNLLDLLLLLAASCFSFLFFSWVVSPKIGGEIDVIACFLVHFLLFLFLVWTYLQVDGHSCDLILLEYLMHLNFLAVVANCFVFSFKFKFEFALNFCNEIAFLLCLLKAIKIVT